MCNDIGKHMVEGIVFYKHQFYFKAMMTLSILQFRIYKSSSGPKKEMFLETKQKMLGFVGRIKKNLSKIFCNTQISF